MDPMKLASGDNYVQPRSTRHGDEDKLVDDETTHEVEKDKEICNQKITPQLIDDNEMKLKDRIDQCRNIIESLKFELNEEKAKLEKESKTFQQPTLVPGASPPYSSGYRDLVTTTDDIMADFSYDTGMFSACVDSKLNCDENLMEYEKQLQKYQNTLNMAQIEKKNAIRKQMLAKAYKLKLLEVENQCNVELLRVKQSLQCLEPLKIIASKWKQGSSDDSFDFNNLELPPIYPELRANSGTDVNTSKEDFEFDKPEGCGKKDSARSNE